jgi:protein-disulfide isomerase
MSPEKKMSKRQMMREKRARQARVQRLTMIGVIAAGALLLGFVLIYPNLKPIGEVASIDHADRPMVDDNTMGDPNAPIRIEEYGDYNCSHCGTFAMETEPQIVQAYVATGKVQMVYRSFGAFMGPESQKAAEAAYCAGDQNKYWEYHDILYANRTSGAFTDRRLSAFAEAVGLDIDAFESCYSSGKYTERTNQDFIDGSAAGVEGTPGFVISYTVDGQERTRYLFGAYPFDAFQTEIEGALAEMGLQ